MAYVTVPAVTKDGEGERVMWYALPSYGWRIKESKATPEATEARIHARCM